MVRSRGIVEILECATNKYFSDTILAAVKELEIGEKELSSVNDSKGIFAVLLQKSGWLREMGNVEEGLKSLKQAEALFESLDYNETNIEFCFLRLEQGTYQKKVLGNSELAEKYYLEAKVAAEKHELGDFVMSDILANLSTLYLTQSRLKDAQPIIKKAIEIDKKLKDPHKLAGDLNILGMLYKDLGDNELEKEYHIEALKTAIESNCAKEAADALCHLARINESNDHYDETESMLKQSLDIYKNIGRIDEIPNVISELGIIASKKGNINESLRYFEESYKTHQQVGDKIHQVTDLVDLCWAEFEFENFNKAYEYAVKAVDMAEAMNIIDVLWVAYYAKARAKEQCIKAYKNEYRAAKELQNEVLANYDKAMEAIELIRSGIGHPMERTNLLVDKEVLYGEAMLLAGILRKPKHAFIYSERSRARALLDMIGDKRINSKRTENVLTKQRDDLTNELIMLKGSDPKKAAELLKEIHKLRAQIIAELPIVESLTESTMPDIKNIFKAIPKKTMLIEYYLDENNCLHIFVLNSKHILAYQVLTLGNVDLNAYINQFYAEMENGVEESDTGRILFDILMLNIWDTIAPAEKLFIVPHKELNRLPFSALWYKNSGEGPDKVYLCQYFFSITMLPSATFLPMCQNIKRPPITYKSAMVFGNPTLELDDAEKEAEIVAAYFNVQPFLREKATKNVLLKGLSNYSVTHIASHGIFDESDPMLSRIELADMPMTVEDFMDNKFYTNLLVLSGCVTGLSKNLPGDNLIGLMYATAASGIPSTITTLWNIIDESTALFFNYYYQFLLDGYSKDEALGATQRKFIEDEKYNHPMYWAPFILFGDCK